MSKPELTEAQSLRNEVARFLDETKFDGTVYPFFTLRFLKRRTRPQDRNLNSYASTREAILIDVVTPDAPELSEEEKRIFDSLPKHGDVYFRTKRIKYGNFNAMWEVLSGQLYALTGMVAPDLRLIMLQGESADSLPEMCVASPIISAFQDLGDFLLEDAVWFIEQSDIAAWGEYRNIIKEINESSRKGAIPAADKLRRLAAMEKIYEMLPPYFHREIEKAFAASKFIANWDFANFSLANIGCCFSLDSDQQVVKVESVFVDFGNSGVIGFGGKTKEQSLERANVEAKPHHEGSRDYDPELKLNDAEKKFLLEAAKNLGFVGEWQDFEKDKNIFSRLMEAALDEYEQYAALGEEERNILRSILFKKARHILEMETKMEVAPTVGLLTSSDLPRTLPFAFLFRDVVRQKTHQRDEFDRAYYSDSEIEMAFRLSLIPDEAIKIVVEKWNLFDRFPTIFSPSGEVGNPDQFRNENVIQMFIKRRDDLRATIPQDVIDNWVIKNKPRAIAAQSQIELAIEQRVGPGIFKSGYLLDAKSAKSKSDLDIQEIKFSAMACQIRDEILLFEKKLEKDEMVEEKKVGMIKLLKDLEAVGSQRIKDKIIEDVDIMEEELRFKMMQDRINFFEKNIAKWAECFDVDPSYNPFDLGRIRKIYAAGNVDVKKELSAKNFPAEQNRERNYAIYKENSFIYEKFMSILERLIPPPSRIVHKRSEGKLDLESSKLFKPTNHTHLQ